MELLKRIKLSTSQRLLLHNLNKTIHKKLMKQKVPKKIRVPLINQRRMKPSLQMRPSPTKILIKLIPLKILGTVERQNQMKPHHQILPIALNHLQTALLIVVTRLQEVHLNE